ncbi:hypothetical protein L1D14_10365 [Vibrio tubiashii]|uniref:hypothetical protein n=1 Tax=Vibrio tubiashii TaxID=29498 RepID=UPI001EFE3489|nr:hypothetical protein [Vibrio tubiashii]MCG9576640.1 hypothetical protein [Vibrio tubiashii]
MTKDIYLTIKRSSKKVNLCYKELAVQICVRTTDDRGQYSYDFVGYKEAAKLIAKGKVTIYASSETKECLAKASSSLLGCIPFGRRVALQSAMKKTQEGKGENLNWFEKIELYMKESPSAWPKSGLRI